jgi:hypothetical protein
MTADERCLKKKAPMGLLFGSVDVRDTALNANRLFKLTRWRLVGCGVNTAISGLA